MQKIVEFLEKPIIQSITESKDVDLLFSKNFRYQGIGLTNCILILDNKKMTTFRIRLEHEFKSTLGELLNLQAPDRSKIDKNYLSEYFASNFDNPFALKYIFQVLAKEKCLNKESIKTQFPPIQRKPNEDICVERFKKILPKVKMGDLIMTYDRTSRISYYIRKIDGSQWSHCGSMIDNFQIEEMTTSGINRSSLSLLNPYLYDIAVYRPYKLLSPTEEQINVIRRKHDNFFFSGVKYNWSGIFKVLLFKKFPKLFYFLRKSTGPTLSDLINSNEFILIDYV
jgi:hypothetical protein